jgi:hypothetical protein
VEDDGSWLRRGCGDIPVRRAAGDERMVVSFGRELVVTKLGPGGVCHVGYVDARVNPDANELARKLADENARTFKCGVDKPESVGNRPSDD